MSAPAGRSSDPAGSEPLAPPEPVRTTDELHAMAEQQAILAELGQRALEGMDLGELLEAICQALVETLGMPFAEVLELDPAEDELRLVAGLGWSEGQLGVTTVGTGGSSQAGFTLERQAPVVTEDLAEETRFEPPALLTNHGVRSGVTVAIQGQPRPWGILGVHSDKPRRFSRDDAHFVQGLANILGAAIDRQAHEAAVAAAEERYRSLYEEAPLAYFSVGTDGLIRQANEQASELLGLPREALAGTPVLDLYAEGPEGRAAAERVFDRFLAGQSVSGAELKMTRADGSPVWISLTVRPVRDAEGRVIESRSQVLDITEKRRAEQRFQDLLEGAPDAIVLVGREGQIQLVNAKTETLFGWERGELIGQPIEALIPERYSPDHVAHRDRYMEKPEARPMGVGLDLWALRKDGSEFPVEISLSPMVTESGLQVMAAIRDMTEREQVKRELREYARKLERSNEEWEQFAHVVSHDLQEPIRMVRNYAQLLERRYADALDEDARTFIGYATEGAQRMKHLIDDLLRYSRVDTEGGELVPVDLEAVLDEVLQDLALALEEAEATIEREPLPTVLADRRQIARVLQNLVGNAIKFHKPGTPPEVRVWSERRGGMWQINVEDNGIGVPPDQRERIFRMFQRLHDRAAYEGTGAGLAICKKIVERHGGTIEVADGADGGTRFSLTLRPATGS